MIRTIVVRLYFGGSTTLGTGEEEAMATARINGAL